MNNSKERYFSSSLKRHLEKFPLYKLEHKVEASTFKDGVIWIGYRTKEGMPIGTTHFDLNIIGDICYG